MLDLSFQYVEVYLFSSVTPKREFFAGKINCTGNGKSFGTSWDLTKFNTGENLKKKWRRQKKIKINVIESEILTVLIF
jgi:hypothetical protein